MRYTNVAQYTTPHASPVLLREDFAELCDFENSWATAVPGMITPAERKLLFQIGRQYTGRGKIIDAGCFLGASTTALAAGLRDRENPVLDSDAPNIHSYDIGVLPKSNNPKAPISKQYEGFEYTFGESFVPELERNIADYATMVELHIGDILKQQWSGAPVEICFLDICKTISIDAQVAKMFFSHFIADTTVLVQQDYFFHRLPWIKVTLGLLADHFEWLGRVEYSSVYRCTSVPSADEIPDHLFRDYELDTLIDLHQFPHRELLDERTKLQLDISEMYLVALKNHEQRALSGLADIAHDYADTIAAWDQQTAISSNAQTDNAQGDATRMISQAERQIRIGHVHKVSW